MYFVAYMNAGAITMMTSKPFATIEEAITYRDGCSLAYGAFILQRVC